MSYEQQNTLKCVADEEGGGYGICAKKDGYSCSCVPGDRGITHGCMCSNTPDHGSWLYFYTGIILAGLFVIGIIIFGLFKGVKHHRANTRRADNV